MPNLSVTTNSDFYLNYTEGNGLNIPKDIGEDNSDESGDEP